MRIKYFIFFILALAFLFSCKQEELAPIHPEDKPTFHTVPYYAEVFEAVTTKATVDEDYHYVFETGDRLYVSGEGDNAEKLYGFLHMTTGAGTTSAHFEGDLYCADDLELMSTTSISITLVSSNDQIHTISGARVTGTSYSTGQIASDFGEAVSRFSNFTSSGQFGDHAFTLNQQSSFLVFKIRMKAEEEAPINREITAKLYNDDHDELLRETVITVSDAGSVPFVFAFPANEVLSEASLRLEWLNSEDALQSHDFEISDQTLAANNYYTVSRATFFDGFRIKAGENSTTITFNYDGIQYSLDNWNDWHDYTEPFTLPAGHVAYIKGNRTNYTNDSKDQYGTPGQNPIFTASAQCYISGNIMSLLRNEELTSSAFHGSFSKGNGSDLNHTLINIDIDPDSPLILPVKTLLEKCYMQMFRNCRDLTRAPTFRVEGTAFRCCYNMFRECGNLEHIEGIELPALSLSQDCYRELFRGCTKLNSPAPRLPAPTLVQECYRQMFADTKITKIICLATDKSATSCLQNWVQNIPSGGTFVKKTGVSWPTGVHGIPNGWTVEEE